jgi:hypothetical protein
MRPTDGLITLVRDKKMQKYGIYGENRLYRPSSESSSLPSTNRSGPLVIATLAGWGGG